MCITQHLPRKQQPSKVMHAPQYKHQFPEVVSQLKYQPKKQLLRPRSQQAVAGWRPDGVDCDTLGPADWTIQVACNEGIVQQNYLVHESVISSGRASRCEYFDRLFQSKDMIRASGTNTIPVQLERRAADLFPSLLDFLYCSPRFQVTTENSVGLKHLANLFKVPKMRDMTWKFIKKDMRLENLELYLRDATHFGDAQTSTWVAFECAKRITQLRPDSVILRNLSPDDFKQVIFVARLSHKGNSDHWSELVAEYCAHRIASLDETWFRDITNEENLPRISRVAAMKLLEIEFFMKKSATSMAIGGLGDSNHLSSLQRRCVQSLADQANMPMPNPPPQPQPMLPTVSKTMEAAFYQHNRF